MSRLNPKPPPGKRFLDGIRRVLGESITERVFLPAVADFHEELASTRAGRVGRFWTCCRWYAALCTLAVVTPFKVAVLDGEAPPAVLRARSGGWLIVMLASTLFAGTWPFFGSFMAAALIAGTCLAVAMRTWHARHPSLVRDPGRNYDPAAPEINLSAIHVGGDVAGLMFAAGSVVVVLVGLPQLWWYFAGAAFSSAVVAWARAASERRDRVTRLGLADAGRHSGT